MLPLPGPPLLPSLPSRPPLGSRVFLVSGAPLGSSESGSSPESVVCVAGARESITTIYLSGRSSPWCSHVVGSGEGAVKEPQCMGEQCEGIGVRGMQYSQLTRPCSSLQEGRMSVRNLSSCGQHHSPPCVPDVLAVTPLGGCFELPDFDVLRSNNITIQAT